MSSALASGVRPKDILWARDLALPLDSPTTTFPSPEIKREKENLYKMKN